MFGPGEYVPDPTEGIVDVNDLPSPILAKAYTSVSAGNSVHPSLSVGCSGSTMVHRMT